MSTLGSPRPGNILLFFIPILIVFILWIPVLLPKYRMKMPQITQWIFAWSTIFSLIFRQLNHSRDVHISVKTAVYHQFSLKPAKWKVIILSFVFVISLCYLLDVFYENIKRWKHYLWSNTCARICVEIYISNISNV